MNGSRPSASRRSSSRRIFRRLAETNSVKTPGCGLDDYCETAREKIRRACRAPDAEVFFLVGGTQTNATVLDAVLQSYRGWSTTMEEAEALCAALWQHEAEGPSRM